MHLIDIGYIFKGCHIFVQTDTPGMATQFRNLLYYEIIKPRIGYLGGDVKSEEPWEDPLERKV